MRIPFNVIWEITEKGLTNKVAIRVSGLTAYAYALRDYSGFFGGIDLKLFKKRDIDVETDGDVWVILGIY